MIGINEIVKIKVIFNSGIDTRLVFAPSINFIIYIYRQFFMLMCSVNAFVNRHDLYFCIITKGTQS